MSTGVGMKPPLSRKMIVIAFLVAAAPGGDRCRLRGYPGRVARGSPAVERRLDVKEKLQTILAYAAIMAAAFAWGYLYDSVMP
jgi:hypothetical protein